MRRREIWGVVLRPSDLQATGKRAFALRLRPAASRPGHLRQRERTPADSPYLYCNLIQRLTGSSAPPHRIVSFEIGGPNGKRLRDFYARVFGWQVDPERPERVERAERVAGAGIEAEGADSRAGARPAEPAVAPDKVLYIQASDLQATLAAIDAAGGTTLLPPTEVPGIVTFALFKDPAGNVVGLVKG